MAARRMMAGPSRAGGGAHRALGVASASLVGLMPLHACARDEQPPKPASTPASTQTSPASNPGGTPATKQDATKPVTSPSPTQPATPASSVSPTPSPVGGAGEGANKGGSDASKQSEGATKDPWPAPANAPLPTMKVTLAGKAFNLEKANENHTRFGGLSGRKEIAPDGGMIFIFRQPQPLAFVMRDCPIPIDIIYVDATGRITQMHHMQPEPPRGEDEQPIANDRFPKWSWTNDKYEKRLKQYPSRYDAVIAIELKANTLNINGSNPSGLALKVGDKLDIDVSALRKEAK